MNDDYKIRNLAGEINAFEDKLDRIGDALGYDSMAYRKMDNRIRLMLEQYDDLVMKANEETPKRKRLIQILIPIQ